MHKIITAIAAALLLLAGPASANSMRERLIDAHKERTAQLQPNRKPAREQRPAQQRPAHNRPPENRPPRNRPPQNRPPQNHRPPQHRPPAHKPSQHRPPSHRPPSHRPPSHRPPAHRPPQHHKPHRPPVYHPAHHRPRWRPAHYHYGYRVQRLPRTFVSLSVAGLGFYYSEGIFYRPYGPSYVVVQPPMGAVVYALPPSAVTLAFGGYNYFVAYDTYYLWDGPARGYRVVANPGVHY